MTQPNPIVGSILQPLNAFQIASRMIEMGAYVYFIPQGTKACTVPDWDALATRDLSVVKSLTGDKHLNVMVVGKRDGLWVLEFDDISVLEEYEKSFGRVETYRVRSVSGGIHLYFKQNEASWEMGNISENAGDGKKELWSARVDNKYVLAPFSAAYPHNDETKPLTYYVTIEKLPVAEIPAQLIVFLKERAKKKIGKPTVESEKSVITEGGRNNWLTSMAGKARQTASMNEDELVVYLRRLNSEQCQPPLPDSEIKAIAQSIGGYPVKPTGELVMTQTAPAQTEVTEDEPEIEDCQIVKRPEFPRWVMAGTSLEEGLVKPGTEYSGKYPELIFIPAVQMYLNALALHVKLKRTPSVVMNMFVGVVAPYGKYFKSTCCE
jgi:primase-like protein/bifunctional DNA primase/polymerase-like protein